jgi:hypothetical protein
VTITDQVAPRQRAVSRVAWVLLAAILLLAVFVVSYLRTPALVDGTFQSFPGGVAGEGVVTYEGGTIAYVLSARNDSPFPVTLVSATTDGTVFAASSVDLGEGLSIQGAESLSPGDEVRLMVRGSLPGAAVDGCDGVTTPVPSVIVTYRQLGLDRTATITASGRSVVQGC